MSEISLTASNLSSLGSQNIGPRQKIKECLQNLSTPKGKNIKILPWGFPNDNGQVRSFFNEIHS